MLADTNPPAHNGPGWPFYIPQIQLYLRGSYGALTAGDLLGTGVFVAAALRLYRMANLVRQE